VKPDADDQAFVNCWMNLKTDDNEPRTKLARLHHGHLPVYDAAGDEDCQGHVRRATTTATTALIIKVRTTTVPSRTTASRRLQQPSLPSRTAASHRLQQ